MTQFIDALSGSWLPVGSNQDEVFVVLGRAFADNVLVKYCGGDGEAMNRLIEGESNLYLVNYRQGKVAAVAWLFFAPEKEPYKIWVPGLGKVEPEKTLRQAWQGLRVLGLWAFLRSAAFVVEAERVLEGLHGRDVVHLNCLAVDPEFQGQKIAKQFMASLIEWCRSHGLTLCLTAESKNWDFYYKFGPDEARDFVLADPCYWLPWYLKPPWVRQTAPPEYKAFLFRPIRT
ncbi:MAG: GNAT family N-acetyltransferase [Patescibacteria group bacterium]|jgi:GNAT superfamily N-acetyltransferase